MPTEATVTRGDCIYSIAFKERMGWEKIWNDQANAQLRSSRHEDPCVLNVGDAVHLPDRTAASTSGKVTDKVHRAWLLTTEKTFRLRLMLGLEDPVPARVSVLDVTVKVGDTVRREHRWQGDGESEVEGWLVFKIPWNATELTVRVARGGNRPPLEYKLELGALAPFDVPEGVDQRLHHLGCDDHRGTLEAPRSTTAQIKAFQAWARERNIDGAIDDKIKDKLKEQVAT